MKLIFAATEALGSAHFGRGSGEILLDEVRCTGSESRLIDCTANALGSHDCTHNEDAGVRCQSNDTAIIYPYF